MKCCCSESERKKTLRRRRRKDSPPQCSLPLTDERSCGGCRCRSRCLGGNLESGAYFLLVINMMRSACAVNNDDKRSARQASARARLVALLGLPAATHTHTHIAVCVCVWWGASGAAKYMNKAELAVIHAANVCDPQVKRLRLFICPPHESGFQDSF